MQSVTTAISLLPCLRTSAKGEGERYGLMRMKANKGTVRGKICQIYADVLYG